MFMYKLYTIDYFWEFVVSKPTLSSHPQANFVQAFNPFLEEQLGCGKVRDLAREYYVFQLTTDHL